VELVNKAEKHYGFAIHHVDISPRYFRSVRTLAALVASRSASLDGNGDRKSR